MLILTGVAINAFANGGLFKQAQTAVLESRGSQVKEEVEVWKSEKKIAQYTEESVTERGDIINSLKDRGLLTDKEYEDLSLFGRTTIGTKIIELENQNTSPDYLQDGELPEGETKPYSEKVGIHYYYPGDGVYFPAGSGYNSISITWDSGLYFHEDEGYSKTHTSDSIGLKKGVVTFPKMYSIATNEEVPGVWFLSSKFQATSSITSAGMYNFATPDLAKEIFSWIGQTNSERKDTCRNFF